MITLKKPPLMLKLLGLGLLVFLGVMLLSHLMAPLFINHAEQIVSLSQFLRDHPQYLAIVRYSVYAGFWFSWFKIVDLLVARARRKALARQHNTHNKDCDLQAIEQRYHRITQRCYRLRSRLLVFLIIYEALVLSRVFLLS